MSGRTIGKGFEEAVVIGAGAGVTAALRARELDATVALVERATCTNDGCIPTRVLARAARGSCATRSSMPGTGSKANRR